MQYNQVLVAVVSPHSVLSTSAHWSATSSSHNNVRSELQGLGSQLGAISNLMEKGNGEFVKGISEHIIWLRIPSALFRIGVVQRVRASSSLGVLRPLIFITGLILLSLGVMLKLRPYQPPVELSEDPLQIEALSDNVGLDDEPGEDAPDPDPSWPQEQSGIDSGDGLGAITFPGGVNRVWPLNVLKNRDKTNWHISKNSK